MSGGRSLKTLGSFFHIKFWGNFKPCQTLMVIQPTVGWLRYHMLTCVPFSGVFFVVFIGCLRLFLALYEKDFGGHTAIYWEVKYPFPLSNRDVSFRPRVSTFQA